ncbi:MAG: hypothetical protein ACOVLB_01715 [Candidatus Nanopelagicus sp.]
MIDFDKPLKIHAISSLVPDSEVTIWDNTGEVIWHKPTTAPVTDEQIATELARLESEYNAKQYQKLRAKEYPSYADQFDTIFHEGIDAWKAQIQAVKDKYPKV